MKRFFLIGLFLITIFCLFVNYSFAQSEKINSKKTPLLLEVEINHQLMPGIVHCYADENEMIWVSGEDLATWGLVLPHSPPSNYRGKSYYQLNQYSDLIYSLDQLAMKLSVNSPAKHFKVNIIDAQGSPVGPMRPNIPGGFLNYDLAAIRNTGNNNQTNLSTLSELGFFNRFGVGINSVVLYNNYNNTQKFKGIRLDSTWTLDQPEHIATWRFGDSITGSSDWSGAARFVGIQYATNFNTQPNLITFPLPSFSGEAILPSNVSVYINNVLNQQQEINNGPFIINNIPVITGAGTISVVTRDLLGRTQMLAMPYYASPVLLKPNLSDFSYELGFIRRNYGIVSNNYGRFLTVGTYRRGITNNLTLGAHSELLKDQQTLGFSSDYLWGQFGVLSFALAGSHNQTGNGGLASVGFTRQAVNFSYGFKSTLNSTKFLQIGIQPGPQASSITNQAFIGYETPDYGSIALSYTAINNRILSHQEKGVPGQRSDLITASYNRNLFKNVSFICGGIADIHQKKNNQVYISFIMGFGKSHAVSANSSYQNNRFQPTLEVSKNLPMGNGYGYHIITTNQPNNRIGGDYSLQNDVGTYTARIYRAPDQLNYELDVKGGVVHFAGDTLFTREINDSFALVQVPNFENVTVYYQNQPIGRTNKKGSLLIPQILAYQANSIEIEPKDLPLDTSILLTQKETIPYFRSGTLVRFPVQKVRGALLHLVNTKGEFIPAGAIIRVNHNQEPCEYPIGYDGELYLPNVFTEIVFGDVQWEGQSCSFSVKMPETKEAITDLGKVECT